MAKTLMVLGSMSSAGKSLLVTGLCRLYARRGWKVLPFKAQNMSNNAAVCTGGEIGRAQAVQAYAASVEPTVSMNPILLKPESDLRSQIVLSGRVWGTLTAGQYYAQREQFWETVTDSLDELRQKADLIIIEGAGSPAELNLRSQDLVNLPVAQYANAPCLLVGDIDRGGVFAQLLGTLWLLEKDEQDLIKAFVVNKFRGDPDLFLDGVRFLEERSGKKVLGVVPYIRNHAVPEEDAASIIESSSLEEGKLDAVVIHLPHISNFDDFDPLRLEIGVHVRFVSNISQLGQPQVIFLPGSKNTQIGFCGGFQMLGVNVLDEQHIESSCTSTPGLGLLPVHTCLGDRKLVTRSQARILSNFGFFEQLNGQIVEGYEIHLGQAQAREALFRITSREGKSASALDGACSEDGMVWGCHLHGLLENDELRRAWLRSLGVRPAEEPFRLRRAQAYDHLADILQTSLDIPALDDIIAGGCACD